MPILVLVGHSSATLSPVPAREYSDLPPLPPRYWRKIAKPKSLPSWALPGVDSIMIGGWQQLKNETFENVDKEGGLNHKSEGPLV